MTNNATAAASPTEMNILSTSEVNDDTPIGDRARTRRRRLLRWRAAAIFVLIPCTAFGLAIAAGYLKWLDSTKPGAETVGIAALTAATDSTVAILSYKPETVDHDLEAARDRLTGTFKDSYTDLVHDVVIPGSKQQHISAQAKVAAAAPVSVTDNHAVILLFVDQVVTIGNDPPSSTASTVRTTLDEIDDRWLISQFEPI